jgi:phage-related protein
MADGKHIEVAKAYVTIVPSMEGSQKTIATEMGAVAEPAAKETGEKSGKRFGESLAKGLKATAAVIGAAMTAATAGAIATGKAFINAANSTAQYGDNIDKMSQKMGISTKAYQEWDFVMQHCGTSIESLKPSMKTLANAAVKGSDAFDKLGISQQDIANMSQEELFGKTISALQNVKNETERTALASKLLGKGATELGALFNMSADETDALKQQVHDLGGVMSDDAIKAAANYQDEMQNMKTALTGVKNNIMSQFLPGISSVMTGLSKVFSGNGGVEEIRAGLQSVISNIQKMAPQFMSIATTLINSLISGFAPMLPSLVSSIFSVMTQAIVTVSSMIPQLMPVIISGIQGALSAVMQALPIIIDGLTQLVMSIVTWLSSGDNVSKMVSGLVALVSQIADSISMVLPVLLPAIVEVISQLAIALTDEKNVTTLINAALTLVGAIAVAIGKALTKIPALVKGVFSNLVNLMASFLEWIVPKVADGIANIVDKVKTFGSNLANSIKTWFSNTLGKIGGFVSDIITKIKELPGKALSIGKDLIAGLWNGISDKINWIKDKIKGMGSEITKAIKGVFGIHSPSKLWREQIGQNLGLSIGLGFGDVVDDVKKDMMTDMNGLTASMTADVSAHTSGDALGGPTTNYNGGAVTINVYAAEGQDVNSLANVIAEKLEAMTARKGAVYA